jgi:aminoglycoside phosphotransferase (APT) family kinase protein
MTSRADQARDDVGSTTLALALETELAGEVQQLRRLSGGASRETWAFTLVTSTSSQELILRRDPPSANDPGLLAKEREAMVAASNAGVAVPEIVLADDLGAALDRPSLVMTHLPGEALPSRIFRAHDSEASRAAVLTSAVQQLARIHGAATDRVPSLLIESTSTTLDYWHHHLHRLTQERPVLELGLAWLVDHAPDDSVRHALVHGDFRMGNLLVEDDAVSGVLDWELVHLGEPLDDLGWFCTKAWRFSRSEEPAGGLGSYEDLVAIYEEESGTAVDPAALHWWEVLNTFKWGVMCVQQYQRHARGIEPSLELASLGWRTCEAEWDLLYLLSGQPGAVPSFFDDSPIPMDEPRSYDLLDVMEATLREQVVGRYPGREDFHVRVSARLIASVARVERHREDYDRLVAEALSAFGAHSVGDLAGQIRNRAFQAADPRVLDALRTITGARLELVNPRYRCQAFPARVIDR